MSAEQSQQKPRQNKITGGRNIPLYLGRWYASVHIYQGIIKAFKKARKMKIDKNKILEKLRIIEKNNPMKFEEIKKVLNNLNKTIKN